MKRNRIIIIGVLVFSILIFSFYFHDRFSQSKYLQFYQVDTKKDSVLKIGIIGDSWAAGKKLDSILHNQLLKRGLNNKIISSGKPGAKSKAVYQNLFKNKEDKFSSKVVIENKPDYCILILGVNDAASQIGSHYYSYHMVQIIKTLLHYKIKPILVTCPEFDIEETIDNMNILSRNRNIISAYFNNNGEIDNIKTYRKTLMEELASEELVNDIVLIDFDRVCPDYKNCSQMYRNSSHLSEKGNVKLIEVIVGELVNEIPQLGQHTH